MKICILMLAGVMAANAQALVGLPEYGVTLSGSPADPVIENHSSQVIIGHVLRKGEVKANTV